MTEPLLLEPRWYQQDACDALINFLAKDWKPGRNPLVVLPTAAGKTIVFSLLCQEFHRMGQPTIAILAHRKELVLQAEKKMLAVWPEAPVGVYSAGAKRREIRPITIGGRDTFITALAARPRFDVLIVDEAHNISKRERSQYQKIIDALTEVNPRLVVIGFTATAYRMDSGLIYGPGEVFSDLAFEATIKRLIADGFLCPLIAPAVSGDAVIETDGVRKYCGDFAVKQLGERGNTDDLVRNAVREWYDRAYTTGRRCSVFFAIHVEHAKHIAAEICEQYGIRMPVVTGKTPTSQRDEALRALDAGDIAGIVNVGVLTEGWDCPRLDCVSLMRPTSSLGLYVQMVGRGLRKHEAKTDTLVLDFGGNIARFGPIDIARPAEKQRRGEPRCKTCPECDLINKPFVRVCAGCDYEFSPQPTLICPGCGEENAPKASKCYQCGHLFIRHEDTAASGQIISDGAEPQRLQWYTVSEVTCQALRSARGNQYLKVVYSVGLAHHFTKNLMIGFVGRAGLRAGEEWAGMTLPGTPRPQSPEEAARQWRAGLLRPPQAIQVDLNTKYKDITAITYKDQEDASVQQ